MTLYDLKRKEQKYTLVLIPNPPPPCKQPNPPHPNSIPNLPHPFPIQPHSNTNATTADVTAQLLRANYNHILTLFVFFNCFYNHRY